MTHSELAHRLADRGSYWVDVLNLNHWRIEFEIMMPSNEDALASCSPDEYYDAAIIKVRPDFEECRNEEQTLDYVIVHELLHIHLRDLHETFQATVGSLGMVGNGYRHTWNHAEESLIDRLAHAVVELDEQKVVPSEANEAAT